MKRVAEKKSASCLLARALTWDGARWPIRTLPPQARAFLRGRASAASIPSPKKAAQLLADDKVREIRICWVPRLKGGTETLSEPFSTPTGKRLGFRCVKTRRFGDILGAIYRSSRKRGD